MVQIDWSAVQVLQEVGMLHAFLVLIGWLFVGQSAAASQIGPVAQMERVLHTRQAVRPVELKAPALARAYQRPGFEDRFHFGQFAGVGLVGLATGAAVFGYASFGQSVGNSDKLIGGLAGVGIAGIVGTAGAVTALATNALLINNGFGSGAWPGVIAVVAGGIGFLSYAAAPIHLGAILVPLVTTPVVLVGGVTQLVFNGVNGRGMGPKVGVAPIPGGAVSTFAVSF